MYVWNRAMILYLAQNSRINMFSFLKSRKSFEPLNYELRKYFEANFLWLNGEFPEPKVEDRKILIPNERDFPFAWKSTEENAFQVLEIVSRQMDLDHNQIEMAFYDTGVRSVSFGISKIFLNSDPEHPEPAGLYHRDSPEGKHHISIDRALLKRPDSLVATIAHELAHIKLLGENRIETNDEMLTDLTTVFFGLGIFNANSAFYFHKTTNEWSYGWAGYLKIEEWAYALALLAFIRYEDNPEWAGYLSKTVRGDFEKSLRYMKDNEEEIFRLDDIENEEVTNQ